MASADYITWYVTWFCIYIRYIVYGVYCMVYSIYMVYNGIYNALLIGMQPLFGPVARLNKGSIPITEALYITYLPCRTC